MESENGKRNARKYGRNDIILIGILLVVALFLLVVRHVLSKDGAKVVVMQDGEKMYEFLLMEERQGENAVRIETADGYNILEIKDGKASVIEADCPDGLCVKQKAISKQGESLICLPHKLVIMVEGARESDMDSFAY